MKKIVTIILLSSVFLLPNQNVEAATHQYQAKNVYYIATVDYSGSKFFIQYKFGNHVTSQKAPYWMNKRNYNYQSNKNYGSFNKRSWKKKYPIEEKIESESTDQKQEPTNNKQEQTDNTSDQNHNKQEQTDQKQEQDNVIEQPSIENKPEQEDSSVVEETPTVPVEQSSLLSTFEQQVLTLTNAERTKMGLQPLQIDENLTKSAKEKSRDMSVNNYFSHQSPTYGSPFDLMKRYGVTYRAAAENIAHGYGSAEEVVRGWMNSPGHRQNILTPNFTHIGIGHDTNGNYWTQQFIQK